MHRQDGWTGGQASLLRINVAAITLVTTGASLVCAVRHGLPTEPLVTPGFAHVVGDPLVPALGFALLGTAMVLGVVLAFGVVPHLIAPALAAVWFVLHAAGIVAPRDALPGFEAVLLLIALMPARPFGSWPARNRTDPDGGWTLQRWWPTLSWVVLLIAYGTSSVRALGLHGGAATDLSPAAVIPLVLLAGAFTSKRAYAWLATLAFVLGWLFATGDDPSHGAVWLHLVTVIPAWIGSLESGPTLVFYDGGCGLCHRSVRLLIAEDRGGTRFRYAPLGGPTFVERLPEAERATLPDSLILVTGGGRTLARSRGVRYALARLGGLWRAIGAPLRLVPPPLLDMVYDGIARIRHRLFAPPNDACPVAPETLRAQFDP